MFDDTIAAIATPLGEGGLAVIRLSGVQALEVADRCFVPLGAQSQRPSEAPSHTIHYGQIRRANQVIDEVLVSVLRKPRTYTREDVVEIGCHGGVLAAKSVLDTLLRGGARLAEPGEFTKRAFLNGRLDLAQAEAVADLIHARSDLALRAANEQLAGRLSQRIEALREDLMGVLAHVEAHIDFPDEDIAPATHAQLVDRVTQAGAFMERLLSTADEGQILRRGVRAAIIGRPNVGKSSLLNQLLGHDRAIVSDIAGTTRDTIEETAVVRGLPIVFIDTAGLREGRDTLEEEGIRRSHSTIERAEFLLHVLDASAALLEEDRRELKRFEGKARLIVRNKVDLPNQLELPEGLKGPVVAVSALTGQGMESLKETLKRMVWKGEIRAEMLEVMINARHQDALQRARTAVDQTVQALQAGEPLELVAVDLRAAAHAVGEIVGKTTTDDLLDSIFSQFCIGK